MANTLTAIQPLLFSAARAVPRELTGIVGHVNRDFNDKGVAKGDTVTVSVAPVATVSSYSEAQTFTAGTDRTASSATLTLNQSKVSSFNLTAEQERSLGNGGTADDFLAQTLQQHFRAHVNAMESYVWTVARAAASRATGTPGTDPFATDQKPLADALKILLDNGAGNMELGAIISTTAGANLRKVSNLFKVNEAGDTMVKTGVLGNLYGFDIRESAAVTTVTKGTGSGYLVNNGAGYAVGATSIAVDTGTGTILAGDVITFAADTTNKYVVKTALTGGVVVLQEPGLLVAIPDNNAITVANTATGNLCLRKDAVVLVARPGLQPAGGGIEQMTIADPQTGLSFLLVRAVGDGMASWYVRTVYDAFAPNPYAIAQLLG